MLVGVASRDGNWPFWRPDGKGGHFGVEMTKGGLIGPFSKVTEVSVENPESRDISDELTENAGEHFLLFEGAKWVLPFTPPLRWRDILGGRG